GVGLVATTSVTGEGAALPLSPHAVSASATTPKARIDFTKHPFQLDPRRQFYGCRLSVQGVPLVSSPTWMHSDTPRAEIAGPTISAGVPHASVLVGRAPLNGVTCRQRRPVGELHLVHPHRDQLVPDRQRPLQRVPTSVGRGR